MINGRDIAALPNQPQTSLTLSGTSHTRELYAVLTGAAMGAAIWRKDAEPFALQYPCVMSWRTHSPPDRGPHLAYLALQFACFIIIINPICSSTH